MVANATDFSTDEKGCRDLQGEPGKGFEPPTGRLQGGCSTSELPGRDAAGAAPQAALRAACQHAPAYGLRFQHVPAYTFSTLRTFGPRFQLKVA